MWVIHLHSRRLAFAQQHSQLHGQVKKSTPESQAELANELRDWDVELKRVSNLLPQESTRDSLKNREIPAIEADMKLNESELPQAIKSKETVSITRTPTECASS